MNPLKLSTHWLVLIAPFVGGGLGLLIQRTDAGPALSVGVEQREGNLRVSDTGGVAGVQVGDTVLGLEDTQVSTLAAYQETLAGHSPGRVHNLILQRGETESY